MSGSDQCWKTEQRKNLEAGVAIFDKLVMEDLSEVTSEQRPE